VRLLGDRTSSLRRHFGQAEDDIRKIEISSEKIVKRSERIESVDIEAADAIPEVAIEVTPRAVLSGSA
jgi:DNA recombination protein RmuC